MQIEVTATNQSEWIRDVSVYVSQHITIQAKVIHGLRVWLFYRDDARDWTTIVPDGIDKDELNRLYDHFCNESVKQYSYW